jgi:hypothetical protein
MRSDSPALYALAVSNTRMPRSSALRTIRALSGSGVRFPKFMVPRASEGGAPGWRFGNALLLVMVLSFLPRIASAHTPGLSTAAFELEPAPGSVLWRGPSPAGRVEGRFTFATTEPLGGLSLDRDRDGVVTDAEVRAAREDLHAFLADGVEVSADGSRCPESFVDASLSETDGLVLTSSYACPRNPSSVQVVLYYLSALAPGHREVVRIAAGSSSAEAILSGDRRALALQLPGAEERLRRTRTGRRLTILSAVFATAMLSLFLWRWQRARQKAR